MTSSDPRARVVRLSTIGAVLSALALLIASVAIAVFLYGAMSGHADFDKGILDDFDIDQYVTALSPAQRLVGAFFWLWVDVLGLAMIWQIFRLFTDFRHGALLLPATAMRLRRIGAILVAMPLLNNLGLLIGGMLISAWVTQSSVHARISLEDADVYALVVGLVLMAVGHIIAIAVEIDAENRAFV